MLEESSFGENRSGSYGCNDVDFVMVDPIGASHIRSTRK